MSISQPILNSYYNIKNYFGNDGSKIFDIFNNPTLQNNNNYTTLLSTTSKIVDNLIATDPHPQNKRRRTKSDLTPYKPSKHVNLYLVDQQSLSTTEIKDMNGLFELYKRK